MATMGAVADDQFEGHSNLTEGQRRLDETILAEFLAAARVDIVALEAADTTHESDISTLQSDMSTAQSDITDLQAVDTLLGTAPTLTPGSESADVIPVAFVSPVAAVQQYMAEVYDDNMEVNDAAFTIAETGVGAEVSPTGKARLIFTTDAAGEAEISVTDVAGASAATVYLSIRPMLNSAEVKQLVAPVEVDVTFD